MHLLSVDLRPANQSDALTVAALSVQVFLDTYATDGVRPDLAREAFREYSEQAFLGRLADPNRRFILAEVQQALVGFAEVNSGSARGARSGSARRGAGPVVRPAAGATGGRGDCAP